MKFITAEQFLHADRTVIESIIGWWKPSVGDLTESTVEGEVWCLIDDIQVKRVLKLSNEHLIVPLLTVGQLIEFIEWKLNDEIDIYRAGMKGHQISTEWIDGVGRSKHEFNPESHDLLEDLWEVAQEVSKKI